MTDIGTFLYSCLSSLVSLLSALWWLQHSRTYRTGHCFGNHYICYYSLPVDQYSAHHHDLSPCLLKRGTDPGGCLPTILHPRYHPGSDHQPSLFCLELCWLLALVRPNCSAGVVRDLKFKINKLYQACPEMIQDVGEEFRGYIWLVCLKLFGYEICGCFLAI